MHHTLECNMAASSSVVCAQQLLGPEICEALQQDPNKEPSGKKRNAVADSRYVDWSRLDKLAVKQETLDRVMLLDSEHINPLDALPVEELCPVSRLPPDQRWILLFMHDDHIIQLASYMPLAYWNDTVKVNAMLKTLGDYIDDDTVTLADANALQAWVDMLFLAHKYPGDGVMLVYFSELCRRMHDKFLHLAETKGSSDQKLAASTYARTLINPDDVVDDDDMKSLLTGGKRRWTE